MLGGKRSTPGSADQHENHAQESECECVRVAVDCANRSPAHRHPGRCNADLNGPFHGPPVQTGSRRCFVGLLSCLFHRVGWRIVKLRPERRRFVFSCKFAIASDGRRFKRNFARKSVRRHASARLTQINILRRLSSPGPHGILTRPHPKSLKFPSVSAELRRRSAARIEQLDVVDRCEGILGDQLSRRPDRAVFARCEALVEYTLDGVERTCLS